MKTNKILSIALTAFLAAATFSCGEQKGDSPASSSSAPSGEKSAVAKTKSGSDDACTVMPQADVERIVGEKAVSVAPAESGGDENTPAVFTTCKYEFSGDRTLTFFVRRSHEANTSAKDIDEVRKVSAEMGSPTENVPELGADAFWTTKPVEMMKIKMYTLHAFKNGDLYLYTMFKNPKDAADAKQQAIKILQAAFTRL